MLLFNEPTLRSVFPFLPTISLGKIKYTKLFYSNLRIVVHFFFQEKRSYICRKDAAKTIFHLENFALFFLLT